jgi:tetratricopeptide (TPR) repeat protein
MQKALADFSKSIELDAENAFSYAMRGWVYKELGENERAKSDFHQALKLTEQPVDDAKNQFIRGYLTMSTIRLLRHSINWQRSIAMPCRKYTSCVLPSMAYEKTMMLPFSI